VHRKSIACQDTPVSKSGRDPVESYLVNTGLFFQPFCGNKRNWIFRNLEFSGKILEFSEKFLEFSKKILEFYGKTLSLQKIDDNHFQYFEGECGF